MFFTVSTSIGTVNAVVAGAGVFTIVSRTTAPQLLTIAAALGCAVVVALGEAALQETRYRAISRVISAAAPKRARGS